MSIANEIKRIKDAKAAIKQSIENKGIPVSEDVKLDKYAEYIDNIEVGSGSDSEYAWPDFYELRTRQLSSYKGSNMYALFANVYVKEAEIRYKDLIENINTTGTINFSNMFYFFNSDQSDCIKSLDLTGYDVSKGTDFVNMFSYCQLDTLNISGWDFSNMSNLANQMIFYNCKIKDIYMTNCNLTKVTDVYNFASRSSELVSIDMTGCDTSNVTRFNNMVSTCPKLTTIIGELDASKANGLYSSSSAHPFGGCTSLETVYLKNIYKNVTLTNASKWCINLGDTKVKNECLVYMINELPDLINDKGLTATDKIVLTLPPTNTLAAEQVQVAIDKGWQVANVVSTASTYSLRRRMVYKAVECEMGCYIASDGSRYEIFEAINVMTPQGENVGWDVFSNIEEAAEYYGLTYDEPEKDRD